MGKPYSDKRWWVASKPLDSGCNFCKLYLGNVKCEKYPEGIPGNVLDKSFPKPGREDKFPEYCKFRKDKRA